MFLQLVAPTIRTLLTGLVLTPAVEDTVDEASEGIFEATWADAQRPAISPVVDAEVTLRTINMRTIARGFADVYVAGPTDAIRRTHNAHYEFTVQVKVQSFAQSEPGWAMTYLQRATERLWRQSSEDMLRLVNACVVDIGELRDIEKVKINDRLANVAVCDVRFRSAGEDTDGAELLGYFTRIRITSELESVAGVALPAAATLDDVVMP